jgi:hypothetical protein
VPASSAAYCAPVLPCTALYCLVLPCTQIFTMSVRMHRPSLVALTVTVGILGCNNESNMMSRRAATYSADEASASLSASPPAAPPPVATVGNVAGGMMRAQAIEQRASMEVAQRTDAVRRSQLTDSAAASTTSATQTMIIRTGQASIEVTSVDSASAKVRLLAQQLGGYVANASVQSGKHQIRSATLELKLPATQFDRAIAGIRPIGIVESVNVTAEDVGEEYVDVSARLANAKKLEQRLIELLANRTGKLSDVLEVEQALARVREESERYEGRMRYLKTRAAMSTLAVTVHEKAPVLDDRIGENPIVEAFKSAWRNFVGFIASFIAMLGVLIPLGAIAFGGFLLVRRIRGKPAK